jgi:poly-gamma-glutamate capsule biosynthesis protein CapA/YwtB (metallophosphatase superfamily)
VVPLRLLASVIADAVGRGSGGVVLASTVPPTSAGQASAPPDDSPDRSPSSSRSPGPPREKLVVHGTGDVNLDPGYIPTFQTHGYGYAWSGLDGLFERDDLTVVNLECPVSNRGTRVPKEFNFRGDPAALPAMRKAGVEVANLGNNHAYDYGPEALLDTRRNLVRNDIAPIGAGKDEREAMKAALFEVNGWKVAFVGIGNVVDPEPESVAGRDHPGVACNDDVECMVDAVRRAGDTADLVFVSIHWGVELYPEPNAFQVEIAHALIEAGADAVFGHHSHRLGSMGRYEGRPIFWSLGNFVWPSFSTAGATTAVAEVVVTPKGKVTGRLISAFIESAGHPVLRDG